jgi:protein-disulfide isomerase
MRGRFTFVFLALAAFAGCGASCKKGPGEATPLDEGVILELPNVDTSSLIVTEKRLFSKVVHEYMSPCGDPVTLEVCVKESRPCRRCLPAAKAIARLVPKGEGEKEIRDWLDNRFDDKSVKSIDVAGSPSLGPSNASLVIVEFADFECPHCGMAAPILHSLIEEPEFKPKTRFLFKNYPLPGHTHAEAAARATVAAQNQGKFWELHDQLFSHQENLTEPEIEGYAKKLGLDMDKFKADWASNDTKDKVSKDRDIGSKVGVVGTPSIFVNGRKFVQVGHGDFADQFKDWLRLELVMAGVSAGGGSPPVPSPSPSPSGRPSAKASGGP